MWKNGCVTVGNTDMYYAAFGKGFKKLVVLPGLSDGLATVKNKAWILAPPYQKFLRDFTVYMFSRKNNMPEEYSIADMADDQALAMKNLGIHKACVLGVSQGGMIGQVLAIHHPEMVERLILAVTAPNANDVVKKSVSGWIDMANLGNHQALMIDTAEKMYSDRYLQKNRKLFPLLAKFTRPSDYDRFLTNAKAILCFDARSELPKILCPTLIIAGSDDKTVGNEAPLELRRGIANSQLMIYDGLGHGVFEEAKDFYDRVFAFCNA
jgi:pimeloyl-ACP methyl ester carboxylesterase